MKRLTCICCFFVLVTAFVASDVPFSFVGVSHVAQAQESKPGFFQRLFGRQKKPKVQTAPKRVKKKNTRKRRRSPSEVRRKATAALPKIDDANRIVVMGDVTANAIARGLIEGYKRTPSVVISARVQDDISVIGDQLYPWLDASDFNFLGDRVKAVVVSLGTHDRFSIVRPNRSLAFGTPEWERIYKRRLIDVAAQLQLLNVPVIWMLPPPVIDDENTDKSVAIGVLQRNSLEPLNFTIVDASGGFTNPEGQYRIYGASLTGAKVRLRHDDKIGFTKRGAEKLAYYARREIDIILDETLVQTLELEGNSEPKKQSQKVVILTRPALRPGAVLAGGNGRASVFYSDKRAREYFVKGKALKAPNGRADNFNWKDGVNKVKPLPENQASLTKK